MSKGPLSVELDITDLAFGGRGVGRVDGRVVLVEGGYPGDRVAAQVYKRRASLWEARAVDILTPSPLREAVRCRHVGTCGGCKLQGLQYETQLAEKSDQITEALRRLGRFPDPPVTAPVAAPEPFEYRNKMEFSFGSDPDGRLICGLHHPGRFDRVFDLEECHLVPPTFARVVQTVRTYLRERSVPAYQPRQHTGYARFLVVRRSVSTKELLVNFVTTSADFALREGLVEHLRAAVPEITAIVHTESDRKAQVALGDRQTVWYGRAGMTEQLGRFHFELGPQSFFQTNSLQAAHLYDLVVEAAEPQPNDVALDLYCGTGTIGLYLSPHVSSVLGVESSQEAVDCATTNANSNGVKNSRFVCADVLAWLKNSMDIPTSPLVVIDPPRAGLHPDVPRLLARLKPRRVVYVSCNPAALARDAQLLADLGFLLKRVTPLDMFPQTAHMESVAVLDL